MRHWRHPRRQSAGYLLSSGQQGGYHITPRFDSKPAYSGYDILGGLGEDAAVDMISWAHVDWWPRWAGKSVGTSECTASFCSGAWDEDAVAELLPGGGPDMSANWWHGIGQKGRLIRGAACCRGRASLYARFYPQPILRPPGVIGCRLPHPLAPSPPTTVLARLLNPLAPRHLLSRTSSSSLFSDFLFSTV